ncbi:bile acid:sodium symporter family protein [Candidatus Latescibacterota bacterium]
MAHNTQKTKKIYSLLLGAGILSFLTTIIYFAMGGGKHAGIPFVLTFVTMAFYSRGSSKLKGTAFTFWVFAFLATAMYFPWLFTNWGFNTMVLVTPLIQLIMFGMGTKLSIEDFMREFKRPKGVMIGTLMVFSIMPIAGLVIAKSFGFQPEIAAGVILIGACPGGVASNVMAFLANGNVALSVSITAFATLISPIITPLLMKIFAGRLIDIPFIGMMLSIMKMIVLPIVAGLIVNKLLRNRKQWLDRILPLLSMIAILFFVTIVVAHYRDRLLVVGLALIGASIIHNFFGYILGYWTSKAIGLNERDSRTIAIEVGLKNGGMGMGIAIDSLKSADAALAPIIFGKWMNISGSALANYWRQKPTGNEHKEDNTE